MKHPNAATFEKMYARFAEGDFAGMTEFCDEAVTFQIAGKSRLAGKYDRAGFAEWGARVREMSGGSFRPEIHDVMATDLHATILCTVRVTRGDKPLEYRTVHVWRFQNGKPVAGYEYPRDLNQYDAIWS